MLFMYMLVFDAHATFAFLLYLLTHALYILQYDADCSVALAAESSALHQMNDVDFVLSSNTRLLVQFLRASKTKLFLFIYYRNSESVFQEKGSDLHRKCKQ